MRGRRNTTQKREKKTAAQNSSRVHCATKISRVHSPAEKNTKVLSSRHSVHVKENERNGQDYQKYALFVPFLRLFFSLLLSLSFVPMLRFLRVRILSLSPFKMRLCVRLCARVCVSRAA
jgi:hypothetical protein